MYNLCLHLTSAISTFSNYVVIISPKLQIVLDALSLWMRQTLMDFGYNLNHIPLLCDNESAIKIANNSVQHSRTKHIDIRHHFLRDHSTKGDIDIKHVRTKEQLADIFTKPLDERRFCQLQSEINILDAHNVG